MTASIAATVHVTDPPEAGRPSERMLGFNEGMSLPFLEQMTKWFYCRFRYLTCAERRLKMCSRIVERSSRVESLRLARGDSTMRNADNRWFPRYLLNVPVRFRCFEIVCKDVEIATKTLNVSRSGLFMTSPLRLGLGSCLSLSLRVPTEISGSPFGEFRCKGRVVHEQSQKDGTFGYGVEIERTEPTLRQAYLEDLNSANLRSEGYPLPEFSGRRFL